jgi:lipid-A-disaccharide synthase
MKYYIIAGERSGDLHASNLIKAIKRRDKDAEVRGIGGNYLSSAEVNLFKSYDDISFMGFLEVILNIRKIKQVMDECKKDIVSFQPDVVILVDFAGFNLRIASFCREKDIRVYYYISPKIWAWNQKRALKIKKLVDKMFVILPFEVEFYKRFGIKVDYVGNPVYDAVSFFKADPDFLSDFPPDKKIIAILPGSRRQEVEYMLSLMVEMIPAFPDFEFIIAAVSNLDPLFYKPFENRKIKVVYDQTYDLLARSYAAIVTSGTATLETAMFEVPQVVCYRTSPVTYSIAKMLVKVNYISLVNLIAGREIVKELIQNDFTVSTLIEEVKKITTEGGDRKKVFEGYREVKTILGKPGASDKAAELMVGYLKAH